jgi:MoxR-like ATPase
MGADVLAWLTKSVSSARGFLSETRYRKHPPIGESAYMTATDQKAESETAMAAGMAAVPHDTGNTGLLTPAQESEAILGEVEALGRKIARVRAAIARVIHGQDEVIDQTLITLLSGGHVLLVGVPGLGKSRLVETLGVVLGLATNRVQFTPDLMPADIIGSEVLDEAEGRRSFRFVPGPVFCQLLMADEINRASPRTQSALLQAMQEQRVAVGGVEHRLPRPFHVLATQNPIEQEGTYPLPEAQLDRFLLEVIVGYPELEAERSMLLATTGANEASAEQAMTPEELVAAQALIRRVPVGEKVLEAILLLVRGGRPETATDDMVKRHVAWGPGPRAAQALMLASRARALLGGRLAPSVDDVVALARPVLRHRMALNFSARADGVALNDVIDRLVATLG